MNRPIGICQWCNKKFPMMGGKVVDHVVPGTRRSCSGSKWTHHNLPKTELSRVFKSTAGKPTQRR